MSKTIGEMLRDEAVSFSVAKTIMESKTPKIKKKKIKKKIVKDFYAVVGKLPK